MRQLGLDMTVFELILKRYRELNRWLWVMTFLVIAYGESSWAQRLADPIDPRALELLNSLQALDARIPATVEGVYCFETSPQPLPEVSLDNVSEDLAAVREKALQTFIQWNESRLKAFERLAEQSESLYRKIEIMTGLQPALNELYDRSSKAKTQLENLYEKRNFLKNYSHLKEARLKSHADLQTSLATLKALPDPKVDSLRIQLRAILLEEKYPRFLTTSKKILLKPADLKLLFDFPKKQNYGQLDLLLQDLALTFKAEEKLSPTQNQFLVLHEALVAAQALATQLSSLSTQLQNLTVEEQAAQENLLAITGLKEASPEEIQATIKATISSMEAHEIPQALKDKEESEAQIATLYQRHFPELKRVEPPHFVLRDLKDEISKIDTEIQSNWNSYLYERSRKIQDLANVSADIMTFRQNNPLYPFVFELKEDTQLTPLQREVWTQLKGGKGINFDLVTQAFLEVESQRLKSDTRTPQATFAAGNKVWERLVQLVQADPDKNSISQQKINYERNLEWIRGNPSVYNKDFENTFEPLLESKMQCLSGTKCFHTFLRKLFGAWAYRQQNLVMIMTSGHILPGQMIQNKEGDWLLFGYESTSRGAGITPFGKAKDLSGGIRVIDPELYFLREIFRDQLVDVEAVSNELIHVPALRYGINLRQFKKPPSRHSERDYENSQWKDPLAFGESLVEPGDLSRSDADWIDPNAMKQGDITAMNQNHLDLKAMPYGLSMEVLKNAGINPALLPTNPKQSQDYYHNFPDSRPLETDQNASKEDLR